MHVNVLNTFMILRLYLFLRVMRNHAGFYSQQINLIASINGVDSMGITFNFKMLLKGSPMKLLVPMMVLNVFAFATALTMFERGAPDGNVETFGEAAYLALVTMSTVGYGDFYPVTALGQIATIITGVIGGTCIAVLLITVFCEFAETTAQEEFVINLVHRRHHMRKFRIAAATVLQRSYWAMKLRKTVVAHFESDRSSKTHTHNAADKMHLNQLRAATRNLYAKIRELRLLRITMPDDMTKAQVANTWMAMMEDMCNEFLEEGGDENDDVIKAATKDRDMGLDDVDEADIPDVWDKLDLDAGPIPCVTSLIDQVNYNSERIAKKLKTVGMLANLLIANK